jgi:hypothetical protein
MFWEIHASEQLPIAQEMQIQGGHSQFIFNKSSDFAFSLIRKKVRIVQYG